MSKTLQYAAITSKAKEVLQKNLDLLMVQREKHDFTTWPAYIERISLQSYGAYTMWKTLALTFLEGGATTAFAFEVRDDDNALINLYKAAAEVRHVAQVATVLTLARRA